MAIPLPMPISAFGPWVKFAEAKHNRCKKKKEVRP